MTGEVDNVLSDLERSVREDAGLAPEEIVSLLTIKAELLALSFREAEGLDIFRSEIAPRLPECSTSTAFVAADNQIILAQRSLNFEEMDKHDQEVDARRLAQFNLWDPKILAFAQDHTAKGDYLDAITLLWRELMRAHRLNSWRAIELLSQELASVWLLAKRWILPVFYALMALDVELGKRVAVAVAASGSFDMIEHAVHEILTIANLPAHAQVGAAMLGSLADYIPSKQLDSVFRWLLLQCSRPATTRNAAAASTTAWEAMGSLSWRLNEAQADLVLSEATKHGLWLNVTHARKTLINVVNALLPRLSKPALHTAVTELLLISRERSHELDINNALNALRHAAKIAGQDTAGYISKYLFPSGQAITNLQRMAAAAEFGAKLDAPALHKFAAQLSRDIRNQVHRGAPGEHAPQLLTGSYGTMGAPDSGIVVQIFGGGLGLDAFVAHSSSVATEDIVAVSLACIEMLAVPENLMNNKIMLAQALGELAHVMPKDLAQQARDALLPLAQGIVRETELWPTYASTRDPLNPFKVDMGDPFELQAAALIAIVQLAKTHEFNDSIAELAVVCGVHPSQHVRRPALAAFGELKILPEGAMATLLMGTRDEDARVAGTAYWVLSTREDFQWSLVHWHALTHSLALSARSSDSKQRSDAAASILRLLSKAPPSSAERLAPILDVLRNDPSFRVRFAAGAFDDSPKLGRDDATGS